MTCITYSWLTEGGCAGLRSPTLPQRALNGWGTWEIRTAEVCGIPGAQMRGTWGTTGVSTVEPVQLTEAQQTVADYGGCLSIQDDDHEYVAII